MENFFGILKTEMFYDLEHTIRDLHHLEKEINE